MDNESASGYIYFCTANGDSARLFHAKRFAAEGLDAKYMVQDGAETADATLYSFFIPEEQFVKGLAVIDGNDDPNIYRDDSMEGTYMPESDFFDSYADYADNMFVPGYYLGGRRIHFADNYKIRITIIAYVFGLSAVIFALIGIVENNIGMILSGLAVTGLVIAWCILIAKKNRRNSE